MGGAESVAAAGSALQRIEAVLPAELRDRLDAIQMYAPGFMMPHEQRVRLDRLHAACVARRRVSFAYTREDGALSQRTVRPLGLYFWTGVWTLVAWCELRSDFRTFRLDRMSDLADDLGQFTPRKGQRLQDYLATLVPDPKLPARKVSTRAMQ